MMSAEVQGKLVFVSNGMPALMMDRVAAMVGELEALGVKPTITVTVELGSTSRSSSGVITAGTAMSAPVAPSISTPMGPMPRSTVEPSSTSGQDGDGVVSGVSTDSGEVADFLEERGRGGEGENGQRSMVNGQSSMVDWSQLSTMAAESLESLESGWTTWRKVGKAVRLELVQAVLAQPTESGRPMTMGEFDRVKPAWMPAACGLPTTFGCAWSELPGLRLGG